MHAGRERFPNEQLKSPLRRFEFIAEILHFLDALQQLAARLFGKAVRQTMLLQFVKDVAAAR